MLTFVTGRDVETAYHEVKTTANKMGVSASGMAINSVETAKTLKTLKKQIAILELAVEADIAANKAAKTKKNAEDRRHQADVKKYLAKNPQEMARAIKIGAYTPPPAPAQVAVEPAPIVQDYKGNGVDPTEQSLVAKIKGTEFGKLIDFGGARRKSRQRPVAA